MVRLYDVPVRKLEGIALVIAATVAAGGCLGSDDADEPPAPVDRPAEPVSAERIEAVRRSPRGLGQAPPSDREVAKAERIMDANAFLGRIVEDAGDYRVADIGLIQAAGPDRILGLIADLRLERPVDGIYELPRTCYGVSGPPFALPSTPFDFDNVPRLIVEVAFADQRVAAIDHLGGRSRPEPGAAYLSVPSTCEQRAARDAGY
jgi:hypothetical protein